MIIVTSKHSLKIKNTNPILCKWQTVEYGYVSGIVQIRKYRKKYRESHPISQNIALPHIVVRGSGKNIVYLIRVLSIVPPKEKPKRK